MEVKEIHERGKMKNTDGIEEKKEAISKLGKRCRKKEKITEIK